MKRSILILAVLFAAMLPDCYGQNEQWDTYLSRYGDKPGSVLVDMALIAQAPDRKFPYLVITGPRAKNCNKMGVPDKDEIDALEEILATTDNFITGVTAKVLAGTFTYKCDRLNYYYVKDTTGVRNAIGRMYFRSFKDRQYTIKIETDKEWVNYLKFLYPDEETQNWMQYDKVVAAMIGNGDSLNVPQSVNFRLFFQSDTARSAFAATALGRGYRSEKQVASKTNPPVYGMVVAKPVVVKMDSLNPVINEVKTMANEHHGVFDGWDVPVHSKPKLQR